MRSSESTGNQDFHKANSAICQKCRLPIPHSLRKAGDDKPQDLNIICYNIGENSRHEVKGGNGQEPTLQEMIGFQQDVYNLCSRLYRLPCMARGASDSFAVSRGCCDGTAV